MFIFFYIRELFTVNNSSPDFVNEGKQLNESDLVLHTPGTKKK